MNKYLNKFFEFNAERFKNPMVIAGIIVMIFGFIFMFLFEKILNKYYFSAKLREKAEKEGIESAKDYEQLYEQRSKFISKTFGLFIVLIGSILAIIGI